MVNMCLCVQYERKEDFWTACLEMQKVHPNRLGRNALRAKNR